MEFHSKVYTDGKGPTYGYTPEGRLSRRTWARGKTTDCTYDAWGNVLDESVAVPALATIRYRFQGREWSAATGLVNFRMRWYDPETGRWLSKDPIGLAGGLNQYAFCGNAPINLLDPIWFIFLETVSKRCRSWCGHCRCHCRNCCNHSCRGWGSSYRSWLCRSGSNRLFGCVDIRDDWIDRCIDVRARLRRFCCGESC